MGEKKKKKRGQIGKILASEASLAVDWATSRLASPADFFPFSPKAETGPRLEFSGNDSASPTYPNGG